MLKAFLFDLDGTIWDSQKATVHALKEVIGNEKSIKPKEKTLTKLVTTKTPLQILNSYGINNHNVFWREYRKNYDLVTTFFADTYSVLKKMLDCRKKLGIVTSLKKTIAMELLDRLELSSLFSVIITPSDTSARKPNPRPVLIAIRRLKVSETETIYVGDQEIDIVAAEKAGCYSGLAEWGKCSDISAIPDFRFGKIGDILALCEE